MSVLFRKSKFSDFNSEKCRFWIFRC